MIIKIPYSGRPMALKLDIKSSEYQNLIADKIAREFGLEKKRVYKVIRDYTRWYLRDL